MDFKEIKCLLKWWVKHEAMFSTIGFLAYETQKIIGSQIEIDFFFSMDTYKVEMLFIIRNFKKTDICEQKLAK